MQTEPGLSTDPGPDCVDSGALTVLVRLLVADINSHVHPPRPHIYTLRITPLLLLQDHMYTQT